MAKLMSPIDYAKLRGMYPQKVYKAIRDGHVNTTHCGCGRKVVVVEEADLYFKVGEHGQQDGSEASSEADEQDGRELRDSTTSHPSGVPSTDGGDQR